MTELTVEDRATGERLVAAMTPGEWWTDHEHTLARTEGDETTVLCHELCQVEDGRGWTRIADADAICWLRNHAAQLLADSAALVHARERVAAIEADLEILRALADEPPYPISDAAYFTATRLASEHGATFGQIVAIAAHYGLGVFASEPETARQVIVACEVTADVTTADDPGVAPNQPPQARWRYRGWCPDCTGEDFQGCFDGGTELSDESYATEEEAAEAAWKWVGTSIYRFRLERDGEEYPDGQLFQYRGAA